MMMMTSGKDFFLGKWQSLVEPRDDLGYGFEVRFQLDSRSSHRLVFCANLPLCLWFMDLALAV
jgi:hypothetical protein